MFSFKISFSILNFVFELHVVWLDLRIVGGSQKGDVVRKVCGPYPFGDVMTAIVRPLFVGVVVLPPRKPRDHPRQTVVETAGENPEFCLPLPSVIVGTKESERLKFLLLIILASVFVIA